MKILKTTLIIVAVLFGAVFIFSFFLPSQYHVERSIVINAPLDSVFSNVNNLQKWNRWVPFNKDADSTFNIKYNAIPEGLGASQQWDGKKLGKGSLTISKSEPGKVIEFNETLGDNNFKSTATFKFETAPEGIKVTWQDEGPLGLNPLARIFGRYYDKLMGKDFEKGLQNLKTISEKK